MNSWFGLVILVAIYSGVCAQNETAPLESLPRKPFEIEELPSPEQVEKDLRTLRSLITAGGSREEDYELVRQAYFARYNRSNGEPEVGFLILTDEDYKPDINWPSLSRGEFEKTVQSNSSSLKKFGFADAHYIENSCCMKGRFSYAGASLKVGYVEPCFVVFRQKFCFKNYCKKCVDDLRFCKLYQFRCDKDCYGDIWSRLCPVTCGECKAPKKQRTTSKKFAAARRGVIKPALKKVNVYINGRGMYRFDKSSATPNLPWRRATTGSKPGEVASFRMFDRPKGAYTTPVYFCKARFGSGYKWMVKKSKCDNGWKLDFRLYASPTRVKKSRKLYVSSRGSPQFSSRVSSEKPCCGYDITTCVMFVRDVTN